jgi:hypothetical protein
MQTTNNRLAKLREAQSITAELEEHVDTPDPRLQRIKGDIESAGGSIRSAGFTRHMEDAMGRAAGMATTRGLDDLVDRATRVLDGEVELSGEPETVVERETDDRGRLTLGSEFADQRVEVAVLSAERPDDAEVPDDD